MNSLEPHIKLLIERAQQKDMAAFHELYTILVDRVFAYIRSRIGNTEDASDCTQRTFIDLWKALPRFRFEGEPQFYGFLFTIIKRQLMVEWKAQRRAPQLLTNEDDVPEERAERENEEVVARALQTLPPADREIIVLHHWSRYTFREIGQMLNLTETSVRVRHHRALKVLKKYLHDTL